MNSDKSESFPPEPRKRWRRSIPKLLAALLLGGAPLMAISLHFLSASTPLPSPRQTTQAAEDFRRGLHLLNYGEKERGIRLLRRALRLDRDSTRNAFCEVAAALVRHGQVEEALSQLYTALILDSGNVPARMELAKMLATQGILREAIIQYRVVLDLSPANRDARFNCAVLAEMTGNIEEAADSYRMLFQLDPTDQTVRDRLSNLERNR